MNRCEESVTIRDSESVSQNALDRKLEDDFKIQRPYFRAKMFLLIYTHIVTLLVIVFVIPQRLTIVNVLLFLAFVYFGGFGITAGLHRLWSHRSYKANLPLQALLLLAYSTGVQHPIYHWVLNHRLHHKYPDTDADPHNAKRGFFFSHIGWLFTKEHPEVTRRKPEIDISDITGDPLLRFFDKYYAALGFIFSVTVPMLVFVYLGQETWLTAFALVFFRHTVLLHFTLSVNSFAHMYGQRPYDKRILPRNNAGVSLISLGEGWHNYHHTFPWDYKTSEFGNYLNPTARLINMFAKIGWAYDLKTPSASLVQTYIRKYGDGSVLSEVPEEDNKFE